MKPYRRRLIGLPLQRSVFSNIDRAPVLIGLTGVLPDDRLGAWLSDDGDLFLDRANIDRLTAALPERISREFLESMERSLHAACDGVQRTSEYCRARARSADPVEVRRLLGELGASVETLVQFGILSKFVPDVLYEVFASETKADIPRPRGASPGAVLARESFALFKDCEKSGFGADRLLAEWPGVPDAIGEQVLAFCDRHTGFGPLRWETPGYENPRYVFGAFRSIFPDGDPGRMTRRLPAGEWARWERDARSPLSTDETLARVIAVWLAFLERETWYVRRAFYVGLVPLLGCLATEYRQSVGDFEVEDVLFLELGELAGPQLDIRLARLRRAKYLSNTEYLTENGISADRLAAVLKSA